MWVAMVIVGAVLIAFSAVQIVRANPDDLIPWFGKPVHESGVGLVTRLIGFALMLIGIVFVPAEQALTGLALVVLGMLAPVGVTVAHNGRVHARRARGQGNDRATGSD